MSAFLGPIHFWLYHKVQLQEELNQEILKASVKKGWRADLADEIDKACGEADFRPLEEVIDESNIHGWLQGRVSVTESRLALLVTKLLQEDASRMADIKQIAFDFGKNHAAQGDVSVQDAFQLLENSLLDGMPCDRVNNVISAEADRIVWEHSQCVHGQYWKAAGGDVEIYYALRTKMIEGMFAESGIRFMDNGNKNYEMIRG